MPVVTCECGRKFRIPRGKTGRTVKCPGCGKPTAAPVDKVAESQILDAPSRDSRHFRAMADVIRRGESETPAADTKKSSAFGRFGAKKLITTARGEGKKAPTRDEQLEAIEALGGSDDPAAKDALTSLATASVESLKVRVAAIEALGRTPDRRATADLVELLDSTEAEVRQAAVAALGKRGDRRGVRPLLHFGLQHPHAKYLAYDALLKLEQEAVTDLLDAVNNADAGLVLEAVVILGRLKSARAVPSLIQVIDARPSLIRAHAAEALGQIGDRRAVIALIPLLADQNLGVRLNAAAALAHIPDKQALDALCRALRDEDDDVRIHALQALGAIADERAVPAILACLEHPATEVQVVAAEALGQCGDVRAVTPLIERLQAPEEAIQLRAISALRRLKDSRATAALVSLLNDPRDPIRQRVVDALGQIGDVEVAARIEQCLKRDRSELVRAAAAKALGDLGDPGAIDALVDALRDEFPVRCRAVVSLGVLKDEAAMPAIAALLRDPAPEIRFHAVGALAEINPPQAKTLLEPLIEDSQAMVRRGVAKALEKLGDPRAAELVANADRTTVKRSVRNTMKQLRGAAAFLTPSWLAGVLPSTSLGKAIVAAVGLVVVGAGVVGVSGLPSFIPSRSGTIVLRGKVQSVAFSADGQTVAVGRTRGLIEIWNLNGKSVEKSTESTLIRPILATSEPHLFLLPRNNTLQLWNASTESKPGKTLTAHKKPISAVALTPDRKTAVTIDAERVVYSWSLPSGEVGPALQLPANTAVGMIAVLPGGKRIVTADTKNNIIFWDLEAAQQVGGLPQQKTPVTCLAVSPDGKTLAVGGLNQLAYWSLETRKELPAPSVAGSVSLLTYSPNGTYLAYVVGSTIFLASPGDAAAKPKAIAIDETDGLESLSFSPDEKQLAAGGPENSKLFVCDVESGEVTKRLDL